SVISPRGASSSSGRWCWPATAVRGAIRTACSASVALLRTCHCSGGVCTLSLSSPPSRAWLGYSLPLGRLRSGRGGGSWSVATRPRGSRRAGIGRQARGPGGRQNTAGASNDSRILEVQSGQRLLHHAVPSENNDAPVFVYLHRHGRRQDYVDYGCVLHHQRSGTVCANGLIVPLDAVDRAVVAAVVRDVLNEAVLETALYKAMAALEAPVDEGPSAALREELARGGVGTTRLAPPIGARVQEPERRRAYLLAELRTLERRAHREAVDVDLVLDLLREALADWRSLLRQGTGPARQGLPSLLAGRLVFTPRECPDGRFYESEGAWDGQQGNRRICSSKRACDTVKSMPPSANRSAATRVPTIIVHGGAGADPGEGRDELRRGMRAAAVAGWQVLSSGGAALDAVE